MNIKDYRKEVEEFEANMLDGDNIIDCGKAMFSAEVCLEYSIQRKIEMLNEIESRIINIKSLNGNAEAFKLTVLDIIREEKNKM